MSVTIPADLHRSMVKEFQAEYETEFGDLNTVVEYTRQEMIEKYAEDIRFWRARLPDITADRKPDIRTICAHAIASNALVNMEKACKDRGLHESVQRALQIV